MKRTFLLVCCLFIGFWSYAQLTTRVVRDSLFIPWELVYGPDDHIWFTQKNGYICRLEPQSGKIDTLYHEANTVINGEGGMLGMALHPNFSTDPYVYVAYEYNQSGYKERIVRYTYSGNSLSSPQILLDNITGAGIHNGCRLLIVGDKLFISTGDASNSATAQNIQTLNGKTLRINLDGTIPVDNPFPGSPLWSWGHRNAQGMVYANNKLYQSEHGPGSDDEINIVMKGKNYGWPTVTGFCNTPTEIAFCNDSNVVEPLHAWTPTIATSGMDYYQHPMFPAFQNSLLLTTLKDSKLYQLQLNTTYDTIVSVTPVAGISFGRLRDICIAPDGKIYLSTSNSSAGGTGAKVDKIIEVYDPLFTSVADMRKGSLGVFPNPANEKVRIVISQGKPNSVFEYCLTDVAGRQIECHKETGKEIVLSIRHLVPGVYQIHLTTKDGNIYTGKIMKQ